MNLWSLHNKPLELKGFEYFLNNIAGDYEIEDLLLNPDTMEYVRQQNIAPNAVKDMTGMVQYVNENEFKKLMHQCRNLVQDHVYDTVSEWEIEDDYYYDYIKELGHVDEDGEIDWDSAPSYAEYNSNAKALLNDLNELFEDVSLNYWTNVAHEFKEYEELDKDDFSTFYITNLPVLIEDKAELFIIKEYCNKHLYIEIDRSRPNSEYLTFKVSEINSNKG